MIDADDGPIPRVTRVLYPTPSPRELPKWASGELNWALRPEEQPILPLLNDVYVALGAGARTLVVMGARAIIDIAITSKAEHDRDFESKLKTVQEKGLIGPMQVQILEAAYDAGSAAAHRGYSPKLGDVTNLLDITEALIEELYVKPLREDEHAAAAAAIKSKTPPRPARKRKPRSSA